MTLLSRILVALDDCRYRESEAVSEADLRDRRHHNAGVNAAEIVVRRELGVEQTRAALAAELREAPALDLRVKAELTGVE